MKRICIYLAFLFVIFLTIPSLGYGQVPDSTWGKTAEKYPSFKFKGLFQARYVVSANEDVDVTGLHHEDHSGTSNSFLFSICALRCRQK